MAEQNPTLADLSPALQTLRQAVVAYVDRGAIPVEDIPTLCMHVAALDRDGKPPTVRWMRDLAEYLPGAYQHAADGLKGSVSDVHAGLERQAFTAEQLLQAIGDGMMLCAEDPPTLTWRPFISVYPIAEENGQPATLHMRPGPSMGPDTRCDADLEHFAPARGHWRYHMANLKARAPVLATALAAEWSTDKASPSEISDHLYRMGQAAAALLAALPKRDGSAS